MSEQCACMLVDFCRKKENEPSSKSNEIHNICILMQSIISPFFLSNLCKAKAAGDLNVSDINTF